MNSKDRLDRLRLRRGRTWDEIGTDLGLSRTMLHYVRRGERSLSAKAMVRLRVLETESGIEPPVTNIRITASPTRDSIVATMMHSLSELTDASPQMREFLAQYIQGLAKKLALIVRTENLQARQARKKKH